MTPFSFLMRCVVLTMVAAVCWLAPLFLVKGSVTALMMVAAQGHFTMAYLYHYRSGKITAGYALGFGSAFLLLFGSYALFQWTTLLGFVVSGYFIIHFLYDERHMTQEPPEFSGWLRALPTVFVLGADVLCRYTAAPLLPTYWACLAAALVLVAWLIAQMLWQGRRPGLGDWYFLLIFLLSSAIVFSGHLFPGPLSESAINFAILAHVANWYLNYFLRLRDDRKALGKFFGEVILLNAVLAIGFVVYYSHIDQPGPFIGWLGYYFLQPYFQLWAMLHYFVTFRASDFRNWVPATLAR